MIFGGFLLVETGEKAEEMLEIIKKAGEKDSVLRIKTICTLRKVLETNQLSKKTSLKILSTVRKLLNTQDKGVRVEIALILGEIAIKTPEATRKCLNSLDELINDSFPLIRKTALKSFEKVLFESKNISGDIAAKIAKIILRLTTDKDRDVRKQAIKTVRKFKHMK